MTLILLKQSGTRLKVETHNVEQENALTMAEALSRFFCTTAYVRFYGTLAIFRDGHRICKSFVKVNVEK